MLLKEKVSHVGSKAKADFEYVRLSINWWGLTLERIIVYKYVVLIGSIKKRDSGILSVLYGYYPKLGLCSAVLRRPI